MLQESVNTLDKEYQTITDELASGANAEYSAEPAPHSSFICGFCL